jgi:hypothetical protein
MITSAYLFFNLSSLVIDLPFLPKIGISRRVSISCKAKFNPVGDNLTIVEKFGLINFYVSLQSFGSLRTKTIAPVI